ncbi:MAG: hypothetical protein KJ556_04230 [Gammaproteobacteria bacterium]|nr:hypothetical protein [Gammaproteobacteria bacterium]MBU2057962.1 hypothetical protein [Gammaproteobacteria bacterium]MBU2174314.1 hypothetical protein [Gammaproteobacteria bacterium]MBU2247735.1 hypothetical protein [Gammaproteobacteria bacterium]MBU2344261.1 hypothetical protein [Gammaproteobacteria bacterium]
MQVNLNTPTTAETSIASPVAPVAPAKTTTATTPSTADTVTLSAEAKAKLAADLAAETMGSGSGNEPPIGTFGSGSGNEPPEKDQEQ